jgi:hypothetical protein
MSDNFYCWHSNWVSFQLKWVNLKNNSLSFNSTFHLELHLKAHKGFVLRECPQYYWTQAKKNNIKWIKDLPNDVLFDLFSNFFDFNSKLSTELVCKRWHQIEKLSFDSKRTLIIADYKLNYMKIVSKL